MKSDFILPENQIYCCGHSLGPLSKKSNELVQQALQDYGNDAVKAWNNSKWVDLPVDLGNKIARIVGAKDGEVIISDNTSINLYKAILSACKINSGRNIILIEQENFPADIYIAQGITRFNPDLKLKSVSINEILENLNAQVAVLVLNHVNFRTSEIIDLEPLITRAYQLGILVILDVSHSVGTIPLDLNNLNVDFAVGSTYKYLNGGPGAPSFCFIATKHLHIVESPIFGWMGHHNPFAFDLNYYPAANASRFISGTPTILSAKALEGALNVYANIDIYAQRKQDLIHSQILIDELQKISNEIQILSPINNSKRAGHVAFKHPNAYAISRALIDLGVIVDFRPSNLIRISMPSLFNDLSDIKNAISIFKEILRKKDFLKPEYQQRKKVT